MRLDISIILTFSLPSLFENLFILVLFLALVSLFSATECRRLTAYAAHSTEVGIFSAHILSAAAITCQNINLNFRSNSLMASLGWLISI